MHGCVWWRTRRWKHIATTIAAAMRQRIGWSNITVIFLMTFSSLIQVRWERDWWLHESGNRPPNFKYLKIPSIEGNTFRFWNSSVSRLWIGTRSIGTPVTHWWRTADAATYYYDYEWWSVRIQSIQMCVTFCETKNTKWKNATTEKHKNIGRAIQYIYWSVCNGSCVCPCVRMRLSMPCAHVNVEGRLLNREYYNVWFHVFFSSLNYRTVCMWWV